MTPWGRANEADVRFELDLKETHDLGKFEKENEEHSELQ